jgi:hypothetical protein
MRESHPLSIHSENPARSPYTNPFIPKILLSLSPHTHPFIPQILLSLSPHTYPFIPRILLSSTGRLSGASLPFPPHKVLHFRTLGCII